MDDVWLFCLKRFSLLSLRWWKSIKEEYVEFSPEERELYKAVEDRARVNINKYLKARVAMKNYSNILAMVLRLRQVFTQCFRNSS